MENETRDANYTQANRAIWNEWLIHNTTSDHYKDRETFLATGSSLRSIERTEVGEVAGKSLLHLLCNLGSDTLSWARLGALVTGVDFAQTAITEAQALAAQTELDARFICSDLYALPETLNEQFDIVISTYGVLCWMPDLTRWAEIVARYLKPGGCFHLVDMHPTTNSLRSVDDKANAPGTVFRVARSYFHAEQPQQEQVTLSVDGATAALSSWSYGLGEVVSALVAAGLRLDFLHEFPMSFYQQFPSLVQDADGWWRWPTSVDGPQNTMPLLFSLRASR